ncbi:hypothetical protein Tco_0286204 [Tanacetum coccineum]
MHNNIMAAGSKDRPPNRQYADPRQDESFNNCGTDLHLTSVVIEVVAATVNSPEVPEHDEAETIHNMSEENKLYFKAEKEAIFLLLITSIKEMKSTPTVDACNLANEL